MDSRAIEMRLRLPAPEEPAVLPPLVLPAFDGALGRVTPSVRFRHGQAGTRDPRFAFAIALLALAGAAVVIAGALRLLNDRTTPVNQLQWPPAEGVLGIQDGFTMEWPESWHRLAEGGLEQGDFTQTGIAYERVAIILASAELPGCPDPLTTAGPNAYPSGDVPVPVPGRGADPAVPCLRAAPLPAGAIRVTVEVGERSRGLATPDGPAIADTSEPTAEAGWTETIDGQPGRLTVVTGPDAAAVGAVEVRTWDVIFPGTIGHVLRIRADIAGPGPDAGRAAVQAVIDSVDFAAERKELQPSSANANLVALIDDLDRSSREQQSDFFACFPREPGTVEATIHSGPGERLTAPVRVTCTTSIVASVAGLWRITLTTKWPAGEGYDAGGIAQEFFVSGDGAGLHGGSSATYGLDAAGALTLGAEVPLPQPPRVLPAPADGRLRIAPGSFAELLWPGIYPADSPAGVSTDLAPGVVGWRVYVIDAHLIDGAEWYSVRWEEGWWQASTKWMPAIRDGRPTMRAVEPPCPAGEVDLEALMWLTAAERLACFGSRELTLAPVFSTASFADGVYCTDASFEPTMCPGAGDVSWLEADPATFLWGDGPTGAVPALATWSDPAHAVPFDQWLQVTGHFDDALALDCRRDPTGALYSGGTQLQALVHSCRERFVVTAFEPVAAP